MGLEPVEVAFVEIGRRAAVDQPLGHGPADAQRMRHPDRLGQPEPADVARLAHEREAVGREREDAVDRAVDPDARLAQGGHELGRPRPGLRERVRRELEHGRHDRRVAWVEQVGRVDRDRHVAVATDREPVRVLAEVHVAVLDADVRMDRLAIGRDRERHDLGQDGRPRELVGERLERDGHPDHRPDPRPPDARRRRRRGRPGSRRDR